MQTRIPFERLVVCAKGEFVEEIRRLFAARALKIEVCNGCASVQKRTFHHCRTAENNAGIVLTFLDIALPHHAAVAVSEIEHGEIVSVFEHFVIAHSSLTVSK